MTAIETSNQQDDKSNQFIFAGHVQFFLFTKKSNLDRVASGPIDRADRRL